VAGNSSSENPHHKNPPMQSSSLYITPILPSLRGRHNLFRKISVSNEALPKVGSRVQKTRRAYGRVGKKVLTLSFLPLTDLDYENITFFFIIKERAETRVSDPDP
jgi:hypothetical protein